MNKAPKPLPETDEEITAFIEEVDSGKIELPPLPPHLSPAAIAERLVEREIARREGRSPTGQHD